MEPQKENLGETGQKPEVQIKNLRTYQGDVEEAIAKNHFTTSTILIAEQKRKAQNEISNPEIATNSSARNKFFILTGTLFLILGITTVGVVFYLKSRNTAVIVQNTKALMGFSEEKMISVSGLNREKIMDDIISEKQSANLQVNSVLYINTVNTENEPENLENVLSILAPNMPPSLSRSFDKKYMLGIYSFDSNEPFIILTTSDFANSYSGMLKWEKDMVLDLGKIFSIPQFTGSSTPEFKDEAMKNKDLRVLKSSDKKTVLLYSFIDKNTLVITANGDILNAIIGKYNISKQIR
ncbi:MAG: hypothetical protein QG579_313 [Patescibacteria group bacterium]|jgi:hypothetical protein|nr:hypothetical protein [Patescibacteria group bacterium]